MLVGKWTLLLANTGYDGDLLHEDPLIHGIEPVNPPKANRNDLLTCDFAIL